MLDRIAIISIPVSDQQAAKAFYRDVMGFVIVAEAPMGPARNWVQLRLPGTGTTITLVNWFDTMPAGSLRGGVIETADVNATRTALVARGVTASSVQAAPWGRYFTMSDPDGNGWVIQQRPETGGPAT
jgi:catechol 2,3-dioxygenase-like lactoylglutathione lyase family enzyme